MKIFILELDIAVVGQPPVAFVVRTDQPSVFSARLGGAISKSFGFWNANERLQQWAAALAFAATFPDAVVEDRTPEGVSELIRQRDTALAQIRRLEEDHAREAQRPLVDLLSDRVEIRTPVEAAYLKGELERLTALFSPDRPNWWTAEQRDVIRMLVDGDGDSESMVVFRDDDLLHELFGFGSESFDLSRLTDDPAELSRYWTLLSESLTVPLVVAALVEVMETNRGQHAMSNLERMEPVIAAELQALLAGPGPAPS